MIGIIKDLVITPLIVIQMLLVGPLLWANPNQPNNYNKKTSKHQKQQNRRNAEQSGQRYGQQKAEARKRYLEQQARINKAKGTQQEHEASKHAQGQGRTTPKYQYKKSQKSKEQLAQEEAALSKSQRARNWVNNKTNKLKSSVNKNPKYKAAKKSVKKHTRKAKDKVNQYVAPVVAPVSQAASDVKQAWNNQEYVGPVEDVLYNWDTKAKAAYAQMKERANKYFEDKYRNGNANKNYYEYYQKVENGVVKLAKGVKNSKAGKAWRRQGVINVGNDINRKAQDNYYIKTAEFYNQQADEKLRLEAGNPAMQVLASEMTRDLINKHFDQQVRGWIKAGHYKQISGNRQLAETLSNMYEGSIRYVVMNQQKISASEFKKEFGDVVKNAIKAQEKAMRRSMTEKLLKLGRFIKHPIKGTKEFVVKKIPGRSEKEVMEEALGVSKNRFAALNKSIPIKSLKLWPIETLYFNVAIAMSSYIHSSMDSTFNPLYRLDNEEQARHGFNPFGWAGIEIPFLEAMGVGFFGFIFANQAFQKYAPYLKVPKFMRGYAGMGVGSVVSSAIEQVMMHPGYKAAWDADKKYEIAMANGDLELAKQWSHVRSNAIVVLQYELTNSKFWKDQVEHVLALIGSSMAAMSIGVPYDKLLKNNASRRYQAVMNNPSLISKAAKAKNVVTGRVFSFAMAAKDVGRGALYLVGSHPVARIVHFTAFLFFDPIVRPMFKPMVKHMKASGAYDNLRRIRTEIPQNRKILADKVYFDRRVLDIYEGKESWYQTMFNAGDYQDKAETYWLFKDYYDSKSGYRMKQTEALSMSHGRWKEYLKKFMISSEVAQEMYGELESQLMLAKELNDDQKFPKGLIKPKVTNFLNFSTYSLLPQDTREHIDLVIEDNMLEPDRDYGFDESNLMLWQTKLYNTDLSAYQKGGLIKHISTDYSGNTHVIWMKNGLAEKMLFNMVFGKDAMQDNLFEPKDGHFPEFHAPKIIRELPYGPKDTEFMKWDQKDAYVMESANEGKGVSYTYYHPLTSIQFLDPDDSKYKNIIQLIYDRALPETQLGSKDQNNLFTLGLWMEKYVLCKPDNVSNEEIVAAGSIDQSKCKEDAIRDAYDKYLSIFARFIRDKGAPVLTSTTHQADSKFSKTMLKSRELLSYHPFVALTWYLAGTNPSLKNIRETSLTANKDSDLALEAADFNKLQTGSENPYISMAEDIVAATGFLQTALPSTADYDEQAARGYYTRAGSLDIKNYQKYLQDSSHQLMTKYLDSLLDKKTNKFIKARSEFNTLVDDIEQNFNKAMCYLHNRPVEIASKPKTSGVVEIENGQQTGRYYRLYNANKDIYTYTKIEKNAFCDFDQIQSSIVLNGEYPEEADMLEEDEKEIDLGHLVSWFQADGKPALNPEEADLDTLRSYFGLTENDHQLLAEKILDAIMIDHKSKMKSEALIEREKMQQKLAEYFELANDVRVETAGELGDSNLKVDPRKEAKEIFAKAQGIDLAKVRVVHSSKIVPTVSLRTAIASKSVDILRKIINEEAGQYQGYLLDLYDYAPNDYDRLAVNLCDLRVRSANVYRASTNLKDALPISTSSVCEEDFKDLMWKGDRSSEAWEERREAGKSKAEEYNREDTKPGFFERVMHSYKSLFE